MLPSYILRYLNFIRNITWTISTYTLLKSDILAIPGINYQHILYLSFEIYFHHNGKLPISKIHTKNVDHSHSCTCICYLKILFYPHTYISSPKRDDSTPITCPASWLSDPSFVLLPCSTSFSVNPPPLWSDWWLIHQNWNSHKPGIQMIALQKIISEC